MSDYIVGQLVRLDAEFRDVGGVLADPGAVTLKYKVGTGATQTVTPTRDSAGLYHYDLLLTDPGAYLWRWSATAPVPAAAQGQFSVSGAVPS